MPWQQPLVLVLGLAVVLFAGGAEPCTGLHGYGNVSGPACPAFSTAPVSPVVSKIAAVMVEVYSNTSASATVELRDGVDVVTGPEPLATTLSLFLQQSLAMCSGYYCACGWRQVAGNASGAPAAAARELYQADVNVSGSMTKAVRQARFTSVRSAFSGGVADIAFPIGLNTQDSVASVAAGGLFVPIIQSPGLTFITRLDDLSTDLFHALISPAVVQIVIEMLAYCVLFGISVWLLERVMCDNTTFPRGIIAGTGFSIHYAVDTLWGTDLSSAVPTSKVSRLVVMAMSWTFLLLFVSLWATMYIELQPPTPVDLVGSLGGRHIAVVQGTEDEAVVVAHGAVALSVSTVEGGVDLLMAGKADGIAVDVLDSQHLLQYAKELLPETDRESLVLTSTLPSERHLGYVLSTGAAELPAIHAGAAMPLGQCLQEVSNVFNADVQQMMVASAATLPESKGLTYHQVLIDTTWAAAVVSVLLVAYLVAAVHAELRKRAAKRHLRQYGDLPPAGTAADFADGDAAAAAAVE